ncbi:hypothetical protein J6590_058463 [Homalodisca vitripennis]|nr:hypothetical protein J6590_058463 [Homalodisca vitripennis]
MLAVVSRSVLHEHLSGKRNNSLPLIFVKICQYEVYFRARLDDSSVSARCCVFSAWTKSPIIFNPIRVGTRSMMMTCSAHRLRTHILVTIEVQGEIGTVTQVSPGMITSMMGHFPPRKCDLTPRYQPGPVIWSKVRHSRPTYFTGHASQPHDTRPFRLLCHKLGHSKLKYLHGNR